MASHAPSGYAVDDLDWLRAQLGIAHLELDPWGSIIVTPATDEHEVVLAVLHEQAVRQLDLPPGSIWSNGFAWKTPAGAATPTSPTWSCSHPGGPTHRTGGRTIAGWFSHGGMNSIWSRSVRAAATVGGELSLPSRW